MLVLPVFSRAGITCKTGTAVPESLFVPVFLYLYSRGETQASYQVHNNNDVKISQRSRCPSQEDER